MDREDRLASILGGWQEAQEEGLPIDLEAATAAHPDLAEELTEQYRLLGALRSRPEASQLGVPAALGPYRISRELGTGGMGTVYQATGPEGPVALKVVHAHLLRTPGFFKRFLREAEIGRVVAHRNVVRTLDFDATEEDGRSFHFLVMEYVEGQTLRSLLEELERVPEELCRHVAREICKGLAAIHEAGAVHRDLKPENVLITPEHEVKVMDLGVARLAEESIRLSRTGAFVGSVLYAAPEQFGRGAGEVDHRADLHALGVLLYELACGRHPYDDDDFRVVMKRLCEEEPRRLGEVNPQLSPFLEEVVHTLLAKDRERRFPSAGALLEVLEGGEEGPWWKERAKAIRQATKQPLRRIRIPRETAVYGRDDDLAKLRAIYDRAKAGDGQVVLIEGEAGIGKSRLVDEFVARLRQDGEDVSFLFGSYPPSGAAMAEGGFSTAYREHFGDAGSAAYLPQTPLLVPAFDALLSGQPPPKDVLELTRDSIGTCFVHATRSLAAERTTIVLIDDLHFAPEEARGLFTALALAVPGHRILLVGTMRPGVPDEWVANVTRLDQTSQWTLGRLTPKDLARLLTDSFRSERLVEELGFKISVKSDGNPFFAFEIIRGLREGQFITRGDDGTWASTRVIEEIQIPSSVLDLVNARVGDLTQEERDVLDVASCCGFEFDPLLVGAVVGLARIPLLKLLSLTERRHRLVRSAGQRFVFDHHQVQEALYQGLPDLLRESYHAALAEALEQRAGAAAKEPNALDGALCVDLCEHFLKGAQGERGLRYLSRALDHLTQGYMHARMLQMTDRVLAEPDLLSGLPRAELLLRLVSGSGPLLYLGLRGRHEECAREAERIALAGGAAAAVRAATAALGVVLWRTGRHEEAVACAERLLDLARAAGDAGNEGNALSNLGNIAYALGRHADAGAYFEQHRALTVKIGDRRGEAAAVGNLGNVLTREGRFHEARRLHERAREIAREVGDGRIESAAVGNLASAHYAQGAYGQALVLMHEHLERSRKIGFRQAEAVALGNLGETLLSLGRIADAKAYAERSLALAREVGDRRGESYAHCNLAHLLLHEGENRASQAHVDSALAGARETSDQLLLAHVWLLRAKSMIASGREGEAADLLRAARDSARTADMRDPETLASCELALLSRGAIDEAVSVFTEHEDRLFADSRRETRLLLWKATGDRVHLTEARRLLDDALTNTPEEFHESMCRNVRVNREILAAWREEFGEGADGP